MAMNVCLFEPRAGKLAKALFVTAAIAGCVLLSGPAGAQDAQERKAPSLSTDKLDYQPGDRVTISGQGFDPDELVELRFHEEPFTHADVVYSAQADAAGEFVHAEFAPGEHDLGVTFTLTATGLSSGRAATTEFTDSHLIASNGGPNAYTISTFSSGIVHGPEVTRHSGLRCDDCTGLVALPFAYTFYGVTYAERMNISISSNGVLQFQGNSSAFGNSNLPTISSFNLHHAIFAYWDDLWTSPSWPFPDLGVYTSVSGEAPNRIFNIEWRATYFYDPSQRIQFEVRLYEGQRRFDIIYGPAGNRGISATVGVQNESGNVSGAQFTLYTFDSAELSPGLALRFDADRPTGLTASDAAAIYGGTTTLTARLSSGDAPLANQSITFELQGRTVGTASTDDTGTATLTDVALAGLPAGSHPDAIRARFAGVPGFLASEDTATLDIGRAPLSVTANDQTRMLGASNPELTGTISGIRNGDPISAVYSTDATAASPAGTYAIVPTLVDPDGRLGNYDVTINNGTLTVTHAVRVLYDQTRAHRSGSTVPIKLQLSDAWGMNASAPEKVVSAMEVELVSASVTGAPEDAGDANPDSNFRYTQFDGAGGYIFNLKTSGLATGTYRLLFSASGDPRTHEVFFQVR